MNDARPTGRARAWPAVRATAAAGVLVAVAISLASASAVSAASSWPPAPGKAVAFQRVPAGAGVLYSRPVAGRCPFGFVLATAWDRSSTVNAELSGKYADEFGNSRLLSKTAGSRVTMVTPAGRLVRPKVLLRKGDRVCRRTDPQGNKPIADPPGTIMGLPAGFPAHPTVDDVKALGLSTSTRTVPTFQVPQPAVPRSRAQLPDAVTLGSVQSIVPVGTAPHVAEIGDQPAPNGFSPDRFFDVTFTYRVVGGSGVLTLHPSSDRFTTDEAYDKWVAANTAWQYATGFTAATPGGDGSRSCCGRPYEALPLASSGTTDLTVTRRAMRSPGVPLQADGTPPATARSSVADDLGTLALGTFDDFGQEYLPLSSTFTWSIGQDFGQYDPKVNAGCHPLTTSGNSCNYDPAGKTQNNGPSLGVVSIPVGAR